MFVSLVRGEFHKTLGYFSKRLALLGNTPPRIAVDVGDIFMSRHTKYGSGILKHLTATKQSAFMG